MARVGFFFMLCFKILVTLTFINVDSNAYNSALVICFVFDIMMKFSFTLFYLPVFAHRLALVPCSNTGRTLLFLQQICKTCVNIVF